MRGAAKLAFGVDGAKTIAFAPLTGTDERLADSAEALLRRLARPGDGLVHGAAIDRLTIGDRDRALAALYTALYGSGILADSRCTDCTARFEMRFDLAELTADRVPDGSAVGDPPAVALGDSLLRLPTIADLDGPAGTFAERLVVDGPPPDPEAASAALEAADPALEIDLAGTCPECGAVQASPFSLSGFFGAALERDRGFLMREMHLIAGAYHWSLPDILSLTRQERQSFVRLLIAEREAVPSLARRAS